MDKSKPFFVPFRERGVAIWLIFAAIGLLAALAAALAAASRSNASSTTNDVQNTYVSGVLSQAAQMKQGLDHMLVNGVAQSALTFTQAATANDLFGSGSAVLPTAPDKAFATGTAPPWVFYAPGAAAAAAGGVALLAAASAGTHLR